LLVKAVGSGGLAKTSLQHYCTAAAINLIRLDAFLSEKKAAKTRRSRFVALVPDELAS
jgi:transposase